MYKKILVLTSLFLFSSLSFGCQKKADVTTTQMSINVEATEPATEYVDSTEAVYLKQTMITSGILANEPVANDNYENQQAYFSGIDGSDFIAIISSTTEIPETLIIGESYDVYHSEIEMRSFPGQYPEIYKIVKSGDLVTEKIIDDIID